MPNIFMSYASGDKALVKPLTELLRSTGRIEPWFDGYLVAGLDWKMQIAAAISRCDTFLYAITPASLASTWCIWELEQAIELGKPIMPVMMSADVVMPPALELALTRLQWVDFTEGPTLESVAKLVAGLLSPQYDILTPKGRYITQEPEGPPPQALTAQPMLQNSVAAVSPMQDEFDALWQAHREALANELAHRILEMQAHHAQMRFDKFIIYSERNGHRSDWTYIGHVDPSPYEEFVRFETDPTHDPQRISEAELKIWLEQFRQLAYDEAAGPLVRSMEQKLVERGWNSETMTKRWSGTANMALVKAIGYELVDTQRDVFHICLGEVAVWPRG